MTNIEHCRTGRVAEQMAREWAQVPRVGKGGQLISPEELRKTSRGPEWLANLERQQASGRPQQLGARNLNGENYYMRHPDGHGASAGHQPHHDQSHFHARNPQGVEKIFTYGPHDAAPYSSGGGGRGGSGPESNPAKSNPGESESNPKYFGHQLCSTGLKGSYGPNASSFSPRVTGESKDVGGVAVRSTGVLKQLTTYPAENWLTHHILAFKITHSDFGDIIGVGNGLQSVHRILEEITYGTLVEDALPFVSLHFNNDGTMYPVMHPYYRRTLTGRVIGFLDYWMKCFVNGGVFSEKFLLSWDGTNDKELLRRNVVDLKTCIDTSTNYESLRELLDPNGTENETSQNSKRYNQKVMTAFRIIGKLVSVGQVEEILYPETDFDVEYDFDLMPDYEAEIQEHIQKNGIPPDDLSKKISIYKKMIYIIRTVMPNIPMFTTYFNLFKVIIFACYYAKTLQAEGKLLDFTVLPTALPFPKQLPPIPIRYYQSIDINLSVGDIANHLKNLKTKVTLAIRNSYFETESTTNEFKEVILPFISEVLSSKLHIYPDVVVSKKQLAQRVDEVVGVLCTQFNYAGTKLSMLNREMASFSKLDPEIVLDLGGTFRQNLNIVTSNLQRILALVKAKKDSDNESINETKRLIQEKKREFNSIAEERRKNLKSTYDNALATPAPYGYQKDYYKMERSYNDLCQKDAKEVNSKRVLMESEFTTILKKIEDDAARSILPLETEVKKLEKQVREAQDMWNYGLDGIPPGMILLKSVSVSSLSFSHENWRSDIVGGCSVHLEKEINVHHPLGCAAFSKVCNDSLALSNFEATVLKDVTNKSSYLTFCVPLAKQFAASSSEVARNMILNTIGVAEKNGKKKDFFTSLLFYQRAEENDLMYGNSPLHLAVADGDVDLVISLLPTSDINKTGPDGLTVLHIALQAKNEKICELLLGSYLINVNIVTDAIVSPLHLAVMQNMVGVVHRLLQRGADPDKRRRCDGASPVHLCAQLGRTECLDLILKRAKRLIDEPVDGGQTPLHFAASKGHLEVVKLLLECRADPLRYANNGYTPIHAAISAGQSKCAFELIRTGNRTTTLDLSLMEQASFHGLHSVACFLANQVSSKPRNLTINVRFDDYDSLHSIFRNSEQFSNPQFHPLVREIAINGARASNYFIVWKILSHPTFKHIWDNGLHAGKLFLAGLESKSDKILRVICSSLDPMAAFFENYNTLMHIAVQLGRLEWVEKIKGFGIDAFKPNEDGKTALDMAIDVDDLEMMESLISISNPKDMKQIVNDSLSKALVSSANKIIGHFIELHQNGAQFTLDMSVLCSPTLKASTVVTANLLGATWSDSNLLEAVSQLNPLAFESLLNVNNPEAKKIEQCYEKAKQLKRTGIIQVISNRTNIDKGYLAAIDMIMVLLTRTTNNPDIQAKLKDVLSVFPLNISELHLPRNQTILHAIIENQAVGVLDCVPTSIDLCIKDDDGFLAFDYLSHVENAKEWVTKLLSKFGAKRLMEGISKKLFVTSRAMDSSVMSGGGLAKLFGDEGMKRLGNFLQDSSIGLMAILDSLLKAGCHLNRTVKGETLIHLLVWVRGSEKMIENYFVNLDLEALVNVVDHKGNSPLHNAVMDYNTDCVTVLLQHGADPRKANRELDTPLHTIFRTTIPQSHMGVATLLTKLIAPWMDNINEQNRKGLTPWMLGAMRGSPAVLAILSSYGSVSTMNSTSSNEGLQVIHYASLTGNTENVVVLVNYGASVNAKCTNGTSKEGSGWEGCTPLHLAALSGHIETFEKLLELGADTYALNSTGYSAVDFVLRSGRVDFLSILSDLPIFYDSSRFGKMLESVVSNNTASTAMVELLLSHHLQSPNEQCSGGRGVLEICAEYDNPLIASRLLKAGASPLVRNLKDDGTLFHACSRKGSLSMLRFLCYEASFDENIASLIDAYDKNNQTALHIACEKGFTSIVMELIASGCNLSPGSNSDGFTPVKMAFKNGHHELAEFLQRMIDNPNFENPDDVPLVGTVEKFKHYKESVKPTTLDSPAWVKELAPGHRKTILTLLNTPSVITALDKLNKFGSQFLLRILSCCQAQPYLSNLVQRTLPWLGNVYIDKFTSFLEALIQDTIVCQEFEKGERSSLTQILFLFLTPTSITSARSQNWDQNFKTAFNLILLLRTHVEHIPICTLPYLPATCKTCSLPTIVYILQRVPPALLLDQITLLNKLNISLSEAKHMFSKDCKLLHFGAQGMWKSAFTTEVFSSAVIAAIQMGLVNGKIQSVLSIIQDLESSLLPYRVRALILSKGVATKDTNEWPQKLRAWGLLSERIFLNFGWKMLEQFLLKATNLNLAPLMELGTLMMELDEDCKIELLQSSNPIKEMAILSMEKRRRLFKDRPIPTILNEFASTRSGEFNEALFSFDGTPIVALTPEEISQIKISYYSMMAYKVPISEPELKDQAKSLGLQYSNELSTGSNRCYETLGSLLSVVREGIFRTMHLFPYTIQCLTVFALHLPSTSRKGRIAQVATGEGKSVIIAMLAIVSALQGKFVDVITSSQYLARRDYQKNFLLFSMFGVESSHIAVQHPTTTEFYGSIVYGTNTDFEFALLRDGMSTTDKKSRRSILSSTSKIVPRLQHVAIVDEVDNLFIDTALNSARISCPAQRNVSWVYGPIYHAVTALPRLVNDVEKLRDICEQNRPQLQLVTQNTTVSDDELLSWAHVALKAKELRNGKDYVVGPDQNSGSQAILIVDYQNTGRIAYGSRWGNGLHEMVEVKEGLKPESQNNTCASISHPSFFSGYHQLFGLTGTMGSIAERDEVMQVYNVDTFDVPPNRPCQRKRLPTILLETQIEVNSYIVDVIGKMRENRRPILILCDTIQESFDLSTSLSKEDIQHFVLNELQHEDEDYIILKSGEAGSVTVATNTAGRGTDIVLNSEAYMNGGLHVIFSFFPQNLRVECQGLGRCGRQGSPGTCEIVISKTDEFVVSLTQGDKQLISLLNSYGINISSHLTTFSVEELYTLRHKNVVQLSEMRTVRCIHERYLFQVLEQFFEDYQSLQQFFTTVEGKANLIAALEDHAHLPPTILKAINSGAQLDSEKLLKLIIEMVLQLWGEFFSSLSQNESVELDSEDTYKEFRAVITRLRKYPLEVFGTIPR